MSNEGYDPSKEEEYENAEVRPAEEVRFKVLDYVKNNYPVSSAQEIKENNDIDKGPKTINRILESLIGLDKIKKIDSKTLEDVEFSNKQGVYVPKDYAGYEKDMMESIHRIFSEWIEEGKYDLELDEEFPKWTQIDKEELRKNVAAKLGEKDDEEFQEKFSEALKVYTEDAYIGHHDGEVNLFTGLPWRKITD
jgi:hypothetical protein